MLGHRISTSSLLAGFLRASVLSAVAWAVVGVGAASADKRSVTVMTQNLYQGTEFAHIRMLAQSTEPVSFNQAV